MNTLDGRADRLRLADNGWSPIPVVGKRPVLREWERYCREVASADQIEAWERTHASAASTGLAMGPQVAIDVDVVQDPHLAAQIRAKAVERFGLTPFVRVGRAPKLALIYRAAEPIRTRRLKAADGSGDGIDILSDGTQIVAFGIHPDTGKPYQWIGDETPLDATPDDAPAITEALVESFLDDVHQIMPLGAEGNATSARPKGNGTAQAIIRNDTGLVVDGREAFLAACIWKAAARLSGLGSTLDIEAVAELGWSLFADETDLSDGRWTERHARAKANGTVRRLRSGAASFRKKSEKTVAPTYPAGDSLSASAVRVILTTAVAQFLDNAQAHYATEAPALVEALKSTTGTSKTRIAARLISYTRKHGPQDSPLATQPFLYLVPSHRLGEEIAAEFTRYGLRAAVFRGREAENPDTGEPMCDDLEAIRIAQSLGESADRSVCKGKDPNGNKVQCPFPCAYQKQKRVKPDVWIAAHQMLWHAQATFGEACAVIIDEGFWASAVRIGKDGRPTTLTVAEARQEPDGVDRIFDLAELSEYGTRLGLAIDRHKDHRGGLLREHLMTAGLTGENCRKAYRLEWSFKPDAVLYPGMPPAVRKAAAEAAKGVRHIAKRAAIWKELGRFLDGVEGEASGRVRLSSKDTESGRVDVLEIIRLHDVVAALVDKPTLILDATLPDLALLRPFYPAVQVIAELEAAMPHTRIRYVLDAPTAAKKFSGPGASRRNARGLRRYILRRWLEHGRQDTLVVCQQGGEQRLKDLGLPANVFVEHYNNIAGLDGYKHVRLLILVGRVLPEPDKLEALGGALTGIEPRSASVNPNTGGSWYDQVEHGLRIAGGGGRSIPGDRHPDAVVEAVRVQTCESEMMQALGRGRGVNRTAADPLQIDILANVCLPVTVDEVLTWAEVEAELGGWIETAADGVVLESPSDCLRGFPDTWASLRAAEREPGPNEQTATFLYKDYIKDSGGLFLPPAPPWAVVAYRTAGPKQRSRRARFDLSLIADPRSWLEDRLGPLGHYEVLEPAPSRIVAAVGASAGAAHVAARSSVTLALITDRWRLGGGAPRGEPITAFIELPDVRPVPRGFWIH